MSSTSHQISSSDVTVIVAAKNEEKNIKSCVESILKAVDENVEVIVVDDGSTDQTHQILQSFIPRIKVIKTEGVGPSVARNIAVTASAKLYVAFADADCCVDKKWLHALVVGLSQKDKNFVGIGGSQQLHPDGNTWDFFHASFLECLGFATDYLHSSKDIREVKHNPSCNVLYDKSAILAVEGFDPKLWPCEDLDLDIRLSKMGRKFLFTPEAIIFHHRPDSLRGFMKMMFRYGFGHAQIVKKHGICQKIHWIPILLILAGGLSFLSCMRNIPAKYFYYGLFLAYFLLVIRSKSLIRALIYGFYLLPTIISWNFGFFVGMFQKMKITTK